ncbi:hypothetical protein CYMTET_51247 [Cymbomonas tetramitiformis]|uniref:6-phosphofructo-2-kinase domain-containing protein n=1 Tax=Cymbomonas tetramitiformis TaxID=36881 RepID=A0AAE0BMZ7_9CHLO|nr:hypothetical protein CYMTET_51247 [Cymbomonas tetramitiformis]
MTNTTESVYDNQDKNAENLSADLAAYLQEDDVHAAQQGNMAKYAVGDEKELLKKNVDSGRNAILFASNTLKGFSEKWSGTGKERRLWICDKVSEIGNSSQNKFRAKVIFVEVICTDALIVDQNLVSWCSTGAGADKAQLEHTILQYNRKYVTLQEDGSEDDLSYIKLINYGEKVITNKMRGYLPMRVVQFLSNLHTKSHNIYITRHGQSEYNAAGKLGGNPPLTEAGQEYARRLAKFAEENICKDDRGETRKARLWTSSLQRTILTAEHIQHPFVDDGWQQMSTRVYRNLDEIFAGEYEGLTYAEIEKLHGDEASLRKMDKIGYRYPRGESYFDIIARLDPLVQELESYEEAVLVVSHQAVLRVLYSYLVGNDRELAPKQEIPLHTVVKLSYDAYHDGACTETRFYLGPEVNKKLEAQKQL